jgi:purine-cytosine permease-like protein
MVGREGEAFACELERDGISWKGIQGSRTVPFLLLGIVAIGWAGFSLISGKGYYKGCPPGGYDRAGNPFNFWIPTMIILGIGVCMILIFLGVLRLPSR